MAVAYVSGNVQTATAFGSSFTANAPAGIVSGNLLVAFAYGIGGAMSGPLTSPGWTLVNSTTAAGVRWIGVFTKTATGSEPGTYTFSTTSGNGWISVAILQYSGTSGIDVSAFNLTTSSVTTLNAPSVTPTQIADMWDAVCFQENAIAPGIPAGFTDRGSQGGIGSVGSRAVEKGPLASTSATGAVTFTWGGSSCPGGAASVLFSPTVPGPPVGGYSAWYDASQITGVADNTKISAWNDLSGNSFNLAQATSIRQPTYYSTTTAKLINGLPAVWFDGGNTFMQTTSGPASSQPYTIYAVAKSQDTASSGRTVFSASGGNVEIDCEGTPFQWVMYAGTVARPPNGDTNLHVYSAVFNGASSSFGIDASTTSPLNVGGNALSGAFAVGTNVPGSASIIWNGPICELIVYPSAITGANDTSVRTYLSNKWLTPATPTGTVTVALGPVTTTATGTVTATGTSAVNLGPLTLNAAGTALTDATGTASILLGPTTLTATGTVSGPWYLFTPPEEDYVPPIPAWDDGTNNPATRLHRYYPPTARGVNVFKMEDGTYPRDDRQGVWPNTDVVPNDAISWTTGVTVPIKTPIDNHVLFVYYGGHTYIVDPDEAQRLANAGYADNLVAGAATP